MCRMLSRGDLGFGFDTTSTCSVDFEDTKTSIRGIIRFGCYLRDQTWLCVYYWYQTPEGVVSPRRAITRAQPEASDAESVFCGRLGVWNRTAPHRRHLLPMATTKLIMRCVYKLHFRCTLPFPMKMTSSTQLWYIRASAGRYVFRWDRLLDEGLAFVQAGVPSCPDDVTLRSCTREFQMWRRRCKQIDPHWFQGRQMHFWWMLSTISSK